MWHLDVNSLTSLVARLPLPAQISWSAGIWSGRILSPARDVVRLELSSLWGCKFKVKLAEVNIHVGASAGDACSCAVGVGPQELHFLATQYILMLRWTTAHSMDCSEVAYWQNVHVVGWRDQ